MTPTGNGDLLARLAALEDRRAIDDLYYEYLWVLDNREWRQLVETFFAEDAIMDLSGGDVTCGRDAIADVLATKMGTLRATTHYYTNLVVRLAGDIAQSRGYVQSWHWNPETGDPEPLPPVDFVCVGAFEDELVRRDGRWWISRRRRRSLGPTPLGFGTLPAGLEIAGMRGPR